MFSTIPASLTPISSKMTSSSSQNNWRQKSQTKKQLLFTSPPSSQPQEEEPTHQDIYWKEKYFNCRKTNRDKLQKQAQKTRLLIQAVILKLREKDIQIEQLNCRHSEELSQICQQMLTLQATMRKEKQRVEDIIENKDRKIRSQSVELNKTIRENLEKETSLGRCRFINGSTRRFRNSFHQYRNRQNDLQRSISTDGTSAVSHDFIKRETPLEKNYLHSQSQNNSEVIAQLNSKTINLNPIFLNRSSSIESKKSLMLVPRDICGSGLKMDEQLRSDSGRESDDVSDPFAISSPTSASYDSANSNSLYQDLYTGCSSESVIFNTSFRKKASSPPLPPPRSNMTKLSTITPIFRTEDNFKISTTYVPVSSSTPLSTIASSSTLSASKITIMVSGEETFSSPTHHGTVTKSDNGIKFEERGLMENLDKVKTIKEVNTETINIYTNPINVINITSPISIINRLNETGLQVQEGSPTKNESNECLSLVRVSAGETGQRKGVDVTYWADRGFI